jgi:phospholipid/cholesterol/gamma-HCH transport system substrate-binding protein
MDERRRLSLVVGIFLLAAFGVGAFALLSLGSSSGLLERRYRLVTYFEDVQGLVAGAPVRLAGKDVGQVEFVTFASLDDQRPPVRVVLLIVRDVQDRIRSDSVASIGTIGLLGDKYVAVGMGTSAGRVLEDEDELASVSPIDLSMAVVRGTEAIDNVASLAENLNRVVGSFHDAMGGQRLADATGAAAKAAEDIGVMVREVREGKGLLHSLIYDEHKGGEAASLSRSLARIEQILAEIQEGDGVLHDLVYTPADEQELLHQASLASARLANALRKIDEGEGTLGLLVNDPTLYYDLKALAGGTRRSWILRSLVGGEEGEQSKK